jgi:hypothetical protein
LGLHLRRPADKNADAALVCPGQGGLPDRRLADAGLSREEEAVEASRRGVEESIDLPKLSPASDQLGCG